MSSFSDLAAVAAYADNVVRQVPALQALHRMAGILLAEHVPSDGRVLVLGAGGGMELKAFAEAHPGWRLVGVDPSSEMLALAARTLGPLAPRADLVHGLIDAAPEIAFDGATCLLTLHFLSRDERLRTLRGIRRRLAPGAPLVIAHHSVPEAIDDKRLWFRRHAAFAASNGSASMAIDSAAEALVSGLPTLSPDSEVALLEQAGFVRPSLFYAAFTFRGWVAYAAP